MEYLSIGFYTYNGTFEKWLTLIFRYLKNNLVCSEWYNTNIPWKKRSNFQFYKKYYT